MDLRETLIESGNVKRRRSIKNVAFSIFAHAALVAAVIGLSFSTTHRAAAEDKPISAFVQNGAAPPPPPPPPPAPAQSSSAPKQVVQPVVKPVTPVPTFVQPTQIPKEVPKTTTPVATQTVSTSDDARATLTPSTPLPDAGTANGVPGGVAGGVEGGVVGGVEGGKVGGEIGGVKGGVIGGTVGSTGNTLGGTGSGEGKGDGKEAAPAGPLRVGGDVKAPIVTQRIKPEYTTIARNARVAGIVIVEAIIDRHGNVDQVKVVRGLPMGLSESAVNAVKQWKFRPGTLNGQPVDVIFNLTVVFTLGDNGDARISNTPKSSKPEPAPEPPPTDTTETTSGTTP